MQRPRAPGRSALAHILRHGANGNKARISLTVEKDLPARADAYAKKIGISRAWLVAHGLEAIIGSAA
jgi:hypothetical protein